LIQTAGKKHRKRNRVFFAWTLIITNAAVKGLLALIIDSAKPSGEQVTPGCFWKPGKLFER
jgi:hypothetical protein